jgi:hypothetical protein
MTNNPAIIAKSQQLEDQQLKVNKLKADYDAIERQVEEELK